MPELPEVETMAQKLQGWSAGKMIREAQVLRNPGNRYEILEAVGHQILGVYRRGKKLIFDLSGNRALVCHNAMSGFWNSSDELWTFDYVEGKRTSQTNDVRAIITLNDGKELFFHDARLFGSLHVMHRLKLLEDLDKMGPEAISTPRMFPSSPTFNIMDSAVFLSGKKPIKQLLLEQDRLAGVGNIYAAEALWRARIHPERRGDSLKGEDHQTLLEAIQSVLRDALAYGLRYEVYLKVYRREFCKNCGTRIEKKDIAKRSTYFCVRCQH